MSPQIHAGALPHRGTALGGDQVVRRGPHQAISAVVRRGWEKPPLPPLVGTHTAQDSQEAGPHQEPHRPPHRVQELPSSTTWLQSTTPGDVVE